MRKTHRVSLLIAALGFAFGMTTDALAKGRGALPYEQQLPASEQRLLNDPPRAHLNAERFATRLDTLWFGGYDPESGTAVLDGIWDFETGDLQGWTSIDGTDVPHNFRHMTVDSCLAHGNPVCPVINGLGSMWAGTHEDEATAMCWPGGQGYGNSEGVHLSKVFTYAGTGTVTLSFDYFVDSEVGFDFTYVYVIDDNGIRSTALNTCTRPNPDGNGYSGSVVENGTNIGTPSEPASDMIIVDQAWLPEDAGQPFEVEFNWESDGLVSDELDQTGNWINSLYGPFGVDDVLVTGVGLNDLSDYEPTGSPGEEYDDWIATGDPAIGSFTQVALLSELDEMAVACPCPLTSYVMVAADISPVPLNFPHPKKQNEYIISPPAYVGDIPFYGRIVEYGAYWDLPEANAVAYNVGAHFYPWTCPETGVVGWTIVQAGNGTHYYNDGPECFERTMDLSVFIPLTVDSLKVVFELLGDCDDFGTVDCTGPEQTNQSPYWDDIRLGLVSLANAPPIAHDGTAGLYQDCYPSSNTLVPSATARMYSQLDRNRSDGNQSNANMADSVVVIAGEADDTEIYMNYRIYPGPMTDAMHSVFTECGDALAPSWATARLDSAESYFFVYPGAYATYHLEGSCGYTPPERVPIPGSNREKHNPENKILPDGVFTPGTTIEYFFTSNFTNNPEQNVVPDTTGQFFREVEVLPGYFMTGEDLLTPCVLYVDAFNAGAQVPIEDFGLRPYLGTVTDDEALLHDAWDRYDYFSASSNWCAPYARESSGDNGATKYQSMIYRTVLWNIGTFNSEGLRDGDADLLQNFLINDDFGRHEFQRGLWLGGNGMSTTLDKMNRPNCVNLLVNFCGALVGDSGLPYYEEGTGSGADSSLCVRLDPASGRDFPVAGDSYGSLRGNGCPTLQKFQIIDVIGDGTGNQVYVDQDAGEVATEYCSIANDQFVSATNYGVLLDSYSLHYLRSTPDGWTGSDCGTDSAAITRRVADVFNWFGVSTLCDPTPVIISTPGASVPAPTRTRLLSNTPNPFNPTTRVRYELGSQAHVILQVFDVTGKVVRTLVDQVQSPDHYMVTWDGKTDSGVVVSSGVYWARLSTSAGFRGSTKMVVLK